MANFDKIVSHLINNIELGYKNETTDSGDKFSETGEFLGTNHGITPNAYFAFYKKKPTIAIMKALSKGEAMRIYKINYWNPVNGDLFDNDSIASHFFDQKVNGKLDGLKRNLKALGYSFLNEVSTVTATEVAKLNQLDEKRLFDDIVKARLQLYQQIVAANPAKKVYLNNWTNRAKNLIKFVAQKKKSNTRPKAGIRNNRSLWDWLTSAAADKKFRI